MQATGLGGCEAHTQFVAHALRSSGPCGIVQIDGQDPDSWHAGRQHLTKVISRGMFEPVLEEYGNNASPFVDRDGHSETLREWYFDSPANHIYASRTYKHFRNARRDSRLPQFIGIHAMLQ